jgi:hypothetical protein
MMRLTRLFPALLMALFSFSAPSFPAGLPGQQLETAIWLGFALHAPFKSQDDQGAAKQNANAKATASRQSASVTRGADLQVTDISAADADVAALQQCKAACTPQCQNLDDTDRQEECQEACEMRCNQPPGK